MHDPGPEFKVKDTTITEMRVCGPRTLTRTVTPPSGSKWQHDVGSGVLNWDEEVVTQHQPPAPPAPPAGAFLLCSHSCGYGTLPCHTCTPVCRPAPGPPAQAAAGFQGLGLWAESALGGIYLKSHRKVKLGSKKSFCRWFIKNAKEADHSHSLNMFNSCMSGAGSEFIPDCCPRGLLSASLQLSAPRQKQGWGSLVGPRRMGDELVIGSPFSPF